jgi:hypothetical protein
VTKHLAVALVVGVALGCTDSKSDGGETPSGGSSGSSGAPSGGSGGSSGSSGANGGTASGSGGSSGSSGARGGSAGSGGASGGSSGASGSGGAIPPGLLDPASTTTWAPGILADTQLDLPLGDDKLPVRTMVCASLEPGDDIAAAIDDCPEGEVVELAAGTFNITSAIVIDKGVVLRGAGSQGAAAGGTTIARNGGGPVITIGTSLDQSCYASNHETPVPLSEDAVKETSIVHVGSGASSFAPGDLALIDEVDDDQIDEGDCQYFKRVDRRSVSQRVEIAAVDAAAGTLTLTTPLHWTFRSAAPHNAEIAKARGSIVRFAGVESLALEGGENPGYNGQQAGGIDISNAANSWVKDVQTNETIGGMHVTLSGTYRVVVRDSYFHHSANYGFGADCYGIVLRCGAADGLVENNVVRYMNKPILFNVSGGGNVIGYNYADNSWATPAAWQEVNIDTHCAFPHMELMEGNYAPHMGATRTHGTAGYLAYFRNYASSQFAPPPVAGSTAAQTGNITALQFDEGDRNMTVIGNVLGSSATNDLGTAPLSMVYVGDGPDPPSIFEIGDNADHNGMGMADVAWTTLWWHANYDTVNDDVLMNPDISETTLPSSLYLSAQPAWWPAGTPWPWAGSDLTPRVGELPAKVRADELAR